MLQPKFLCHMNVIPPSGRPALIPLVISMDDSEKEFHITPQCEWNSKILQGRAMHVSYKAIQNYNVSLTLQPILPVEHKPIAIKLGYSLRNFDSDLKSTPTKPILFYFEFEVIQKH